MGIHILSRLTFIIFVLLLVWLGLTFTDDNADGFLYASDFLSRTRLKAEIGVKRNSIPVEEARTHATSLFHDNDVNQKFNKYLAGLPSKPYGIYNDWKLY